MNKYHHLFFDLDRTLWDLDANAQATLEDLYRIHDLKNKGINHFDSWLETYTRFNNQLWDAYREGKVKKEILSVERFKLSIEAFGLKDDALPLKISEDYIRISPTKNQLYPGTKETLHYLFGKYKLHIITNGFSETQYRKLEYAGIRNFFNCIIISEEVGAMKPNPLIFERALQLAQANKIESLMIGDDYLVDIDAARKFGMDQVWITFDRNVQPKETTYQVSSLFELMEIL